MRQAWFLALLLLPPALAAQMQNGGAQTAVPAPQAVVPAPHAVVSAPQYQTWSNPELHLTYYYPAELTPRDGAFAVAAGRRILYGEDAEGEQGKADTCARTLLSVGEGKEGSPGVWVRLGVVNISAECFPPKTLRDKKTTQLLLRNLVTQGTTLMGTMPLEVPTLYELDGYRAGFCAADGQPVSPGDVQTAGQQLIGIVVVALQDRLAAWVIETDDTAMFNRILGSGVDFGSGKPDKLFPAEVR